jgi:hypothetical protein
MQRFVRAVTAVAVMLAWKPAAAQPATEVPAGRVKVVSGTASIIRGGRPQAVEVGAPVFESDVLRTGSDGQMAVMLKDETRVSLGPNTEVAVARFAFEPAESRLALALRIVQGAISMVSGRIARLKPDAVRIETPSSVIGVRGTHVLVRAGVP